MVKLAEFTLLAISNRFLIVAENTCDIISIVKHIVVDTNVSLEILLSTLHIKNGIIMNIT